MKRAEAIARIGPHHHRGGELESRLGSKADTTSARQSGMLSWLLGRVLHTLAAQHLVARATGLTRRLSMSAKGIGIGPCVSQGSGQVLFAFEVAEKGSRFETLAGCFLDDFLGR